MSTAKRLFEPFGHKMRTLVRTTIGGNPSVPLVVYTGTNLAISIIDTWMSLSQPKAVVAAVAVVTTPGVIGLVYPIAYDPIVITFIG